ncbi:hypothetical protein CAEBREN_30146 [Caenorhabditis brenneri]|uniref:Serpentine Receptor, class AB (Class A-like) n=1 Tax=Caenorhabditis brenneri TaxID=135651 RepID=G0PIF5_CAEBE|nr:hypothetical protein CAEBREN_30146 [Caenorhabditis brenneri]
MNANCTTMIPLSTSKALRISMIYNLTVALIGLPLFTWASWKLWKGTFAKMFHKNIRFIIQMHLFGFILHCCGRIVLHSLDLYNYMLSDPCEMIPNIYRCFIFRLMYNSGMWITTCTAIPLIIERSIATHLRGRYENKYTWLGMLAFLQPCLAAVPLYFAYANLKFDGVFMPYCSIYKPGSPTIANINSVVAIVSQILARGIFGYLFHLNKKYRTIMQNSNLSTRFQLEQNKNSFHCLKIYANTSTIFLVTQIGSFMLLLDASREMYWQNYLALMELNCQFPAYGILTIGLVTYRIAKVRNQIHSNLNAQRNLDGKHAYFLNFNQQIGTEQSKF